MTFGVNNNFDIRLGLIRELHGRPVRQIELDDVVARQWVGEGKLYLMVEADGHLWLWDGMVDP